MTDVPRCESSSLTSPVRRSSIPGKVECAAKRVASRSRKIWGHSGPGISFRYELPEPKTIIIYIPGLTVSTFAPFLSAPSSTIDKIPTTHIVLRSLPKSAPLQAHTQDSQDSTHPSSPLTQYCCLIKGQSKQDPSCCRC